MLTHSLSSLTSNRSHYATFDKEGSWRNGGINDFDLTDNHMFEILLRQPVEQLHEVQCNTQSDSSSWEEIPLIRL